MKILNLKFKPQNGITYQFAAADS